MKLKTSIILCSVLAGTATPAVANPIWDLYAGATIGVGAETVFTHGEDKNYSAQSFGALFGVDIPLFRIEAEYNYLNESDSRAQLALANLYFKVPTAVVKPYFGGGVGVMFEGKNDTANVKFDHGIAYQGMIGITLDVPVLPFKFDIEGRALYIPDIAGISGDRPDMLHYDARAKIRYIF